MPCLLHQFAHIHLPSPHMQRAWRSFKRRDEEHMTRLVAPEIQQMLARSAVEAVRQAHRRAMLQRLKKTMSKKKRVAPAFGSCTTGGWQPRLQSQSHIVNHSLVT